MDCSRCGALLPTKSDVCIYCGARNCTDLKGIRLEANPEYESHRECPRCNHSLEAIAISAGKKILVDRCPSCFGAFFDLGELELIMQNSVENILEVDILRINNLLIDESLEQEWPVAYIKCPDCEHLLNRERLGALSGIVIDKCRSHGIWLDGGELGRALKWYKAGGERLCNFKQSEKERLKDLYRQEDMISSDSWFIMSSPQKSSLPRSSSLEALQTIFQMLSKKI